MSALSTAPPPQASHGLTAPRVADQVTPVSSFGSSRPSATNNANTVRSKRTSVSQLPSVASIVRGSGTAALRGLRTAGTMTRGLSWHIRATMKLQLPEPELFRGAAVAKALRGFAGVLSSREPAAEYFDLSAPLDVVDSNELAIDTFISHNWDTPRWKKFLVLVFHFNINAAILVSLCVASGMCALTARGFLPHVETTMSITKEVQYSQGALSLPSGIAAFLLSLLGSHELGQCRPVGKPHRVFLDKVCVHQKDNERKRKGIQALAAFLDRSKDILVLYSDVYLQKLWTCYEAAAWLMLHKGEKMIVRPMSLPILVLSAFTAAAAVEYLVFFMNYYNLYASLRVMPGFAVVAIGLLPFFTFGAWLAARWADDRDRIENHVQNFCLADAKCASEEDRALVRQSILDFMRFAKVCDRKLPDSEILDRFEQLVRQEVPRLLWSSFGRVSVPYTWALVLGLPHAFFTLDLAAGMPVGKPVESGEAALRCAFHAALALLVCPITLALMVMLARIRRLRSFPGCVIVALLSMGLLLAYLVSFDLVCNKAARSTGWFILLLAGWVVLGLITIVAYRPLHLSQSVSQPLDGV